MIDLKEMDFDLKEISYAFYMVWNVAFNAAPFVKSLILVIREYKY